jgi:hypothetical protein
MTMAAEPEWACVAERIAELGLGRRGGETARDDSENSPGTSRRWRGAESDPVCDGGGVAGERPSRPDQRGAALNAGVRDVFKIV